MIASCDPSGDQVRLADVFEQLARRAAAERNAGQRPLEDAVVQPAGLREDRQLVLRRDRRAGGSPGSPAEPPLDIRDG